MLYECVYDIMCVNNSYEIVINGLSSNDTYKIGDILLVYVLYGKICYDSVGLLCDDIYVKTIYCEPRYIDLLRYDSWIIIVDILFVIISIIYIVILLNRYKKSKMNDYIEKEIMNDIYDEKHVEKYVLIEPDVNLVKLLLSDKRMFYNSIDSSS